MILLRALSLLGVALAFAGAAAPPAFAQTPQEPGAIERTIPTQFRPTSAGPILSLPGDHRRSEVQDKRRFTLGAVNVDGATIFSQQQLTGTFEQYLATEVDQGKLAEMADAITARYRRTGYLLSYASVPPQNVEAGMVRLAVVEGRIDKVSVQGAGTAQGAVEALATPLVTGAPLRGAALERAIGLIRDFPGLTVTDVALMRSDIEAGFYTLKITVARNRLSAFSYADNRGTDSIGHSRVYESVSISSLAIQGDEFRADLFAMPSGRSRYLYGQLYAALPVGRHGLRLSMSGSRGDQYLRSDENFNGQSDNLTAQLSYPLLRGRALSVLGKASLTDWRSVGTQGGNRQLRDRLRVARFGIELGNEREKRIQGDLTLSQGLGFGGMTRVGDPLASRADASGRFTKVNFSLQVIRPLNERITARAVATAQYSNRPLLSAEEFSLGGNRVGRAFDFNAKTGDRGAGAGIEIGYRLGKPEAKIGLELFGFADGGVASDISSTQAPARTYRLASAGAGARISLAGVTVAIEAAVPLSTGRRARLFGSIFRSF